MDNIEEKIIVAKIARKIAVAARAKKIAEREYELYTNRIISQVGCLTYIITTEDKRK
jgi:histone H3/H4